MQPSNGILKRHPSPKTAAHSTDAPPLPWKMFKICCKATLFPSIFFTSLPGVFSQSFPCPTPAVVEHAGRGSCLAGFPSLNKSRGRTTHGHVSFKRFSALCARPWHPPPRSRFPVTAHVFPCWGPVAALRLCWLPGVLCSIRQAAGSFPSALLPTVPL